MMIAGLTMASGAFASPIGDALLPISESGKVHGICAAVCDAKGEVTIEGIDIGDVRNDVVRVNTRYFYGCPGEEEHEQELLTPIRNITVRNVHAASAKCLLRLEGDAKLPVEGVTLEDVRADKVQEPDVVRNVKRFQKK